MLTRNLRKLLGNKLIEQIVGNHPNVGRIGHWSKPIHCLLNHGALAIQSQHLLRPRLPAARPEPCSTSTCENHRSEFMPRFTAFNRHKSPATPASRSSSASASRPRPQHRAKPHTTIEY